MANDYIPRGDAEFDDRPADLVTYANASFVGLGMVAGDTTPVKSAQTTWNSTYPALVAAAAAVAIAAREGKDAAWTGVEAAVRPPARRQHDRYGCSDRQGNRFAPLGQIPNRPVDRAEGRIAGRANPAFDRPEQSHRQRQADSVRSAGRALSRIRMEQRREQVPP